MTDEETKSPPADKPRLKKVTLKKEHKHRGEPCQPGDQIEVTPEQEERLRRHGEI